MYIIYTILGGRDSVVDIVIHVGWTVQVCIVVGLRFCVLVQTVPDQP